MMSNTSGTSFGKIIWIGEHACMDGCLAYGSSIPLSVNISLSNIHLCEDHYLHDLNLAISSYFDIEPINLSVSSMIIPGIGLGYSTALIYAVLDFYLNYLDQLFSLNEKLKLVNDIERSFNPSFSGIDSILLSGNLGEIVETDGIVSNVIGHQFFSYFILNSGCNDSTIDMVKISQSCSYKNNIFAEIKKTAEIFKVGVVTKNLKMITNSVSTCSDLLVDLGVVDLKSQQIIQFLNSKGYIAKITGAGGVTAGSGAILVLGKLDLVLKNELMCNFDVDLIYEQII